MEGTPLSNACEWLAANPSESASVVSRIFKVPRSTIRSSISRATQRNQNLKLKQKAGPWG